MLIQHLWPETSTWFCLVLLQETERGTQVLESVWFLAGSLFKRDDTAWLILFKTYPSKTPPANCLQCLCTPLVKNCPVTLSPVLQGIEREYQELDTVWFMAGSLFKNYPYDIPTEAFSLQLFTQAFATVQASIVHLQDVTLSKRFALVPLGPPLLSYSSTSKVTCSNHVMLGFVILYIVIHGQNWIVQPARWHPLQVACTLLLLLHKVCVHEPLHVCLGSCGQHFLVLQAPMKPDSCTVHAHVTL